MQLINTSEQPQVVVSVAELDLSRSRLALQIKHTLDHGEVYHGKSYGICKEMERNSPLGFTYIIAGKESDYINSFTWCRDAVECFIVLEEQDA